MAELDENAPVKSASEIEIDAPPEVVWDVLTGFADWPSWNPDVKSMSFQGALEPGSEFRWKAGPGNSYRRSSASSRRTRSSGPDER